MTEILKDCFHKLNINITDFQIRQFEAYYEFLISCNKKINLTAITDKADVAVKHFADSASLLCAVNIKEGAKVIDVGTGAGFPGVVLKIMRPDIEITLLDSLNKRIAFLKELCLLLNIEARCIHARAEDAAKKAELRESFDIASSRAVANLRTLSEYCLPFVKVGGVFAPLKGPSADSEVCEAVNAVKILGGSEAKIKEISIADFSHKIVLIDKISKTPSKYPRNGAKPLNNPLK